MEYAHVALTLAHSCFKDTDVPGYSGAEHMFGGRQVNGTRFCSLMDVLVSTVVPVNATLTLVSNILTDSVEDQLWCGLA